MARGKTLEEILNGVRAEARLSLAPAANTQVRDSQIILIQREQERLWEDYNWPHLRVYPTFALQAGQFEYDLPANLSMDRVEMLEVHDGGCWRPLRPGIGSAQYSQYETSLNQRSWPARHWQANDTDQIEIWPIPDQNADATTLEGYVKVTGIRSLAKLEADADRADLDDRLIILYVAGGILAATGAKDAQLKLEAANKLYSRLKGRQMKVKSFNMFGTTERQAPALRGPRNYMDR